MIGRGLMAGCSEEPGIGGGEGIGVSLAVEPVVTGWGASTATGFAGAGGGSAIGSDPPARPATQVRTCISTASSTSFIMP